MNDVNETSSEFGITALGILDFPQTPHLLNKKAIKFTMSPQSNDSTQYYSRLGLNMYPLPKGFYTLVVELYSPNDQIKEFEALSSIINIKKQGFVAAGKAWKNVIQIQKNVVTTPDYLLIDMKCGVGQNSSNVGWVILWGIKGLHNSVPSSVYDRIYLVQNDGLLMETGINMNSHKLTNASCNWPVNNSDIATKEYVDISVIFSILNSATSTYADGFIKEQAECLYLCEKGNLNEVEINSSTRKILTLFDHPLSGLNAQQTDPLKQPILSTVKNAKGISFVLMDKMTKWFQTLI